MTINGEFILREVVGENILVPVGETALRINGIISLNEISALIWTGITEGKEREEILGEILDTFEVEQGEAGRDLDEFLEILKKHDLIV